MAVLKYRSTDGSIKTLPIIANGDGSGTIPADVMATIDQHTEDIVGLETQTQQLTTAVGAINDSLPTKYSAINPPPYPVTSVNDITGNIYTYETTFNDGSESTLSIPPKCIRVISISNINISVNNANYIRLATWSNASIVGVGSCMSSFSGRPVACLAVSGNEAYMYGFSGSDEPSQIVSFSFALLNYGISAATIKLTRYAE